jgi:hypothetical protein
MAHPALGPLILTRLEDPGVAEVMLNPDGRMRIDRFDGGLADTGLTILAQDAERILRLLAQGLARADQHPGGRPHLQRQDRSGQRPAGPDRHGRRPLVLLEDLRDLQRAADNGVALPFDLDWGLTAGLGSLFASVERGSSAALSISKPAPNWKAAGSTGAAVSRLKARMDAANGRTEMRHGPRLGFNLSAIPKTLA